MHDARPRGPRRVLSPVGELVEEDPENVYNLEWWSRTARMFIFIVHHWMFDLISTKGLGVQIICKLGGEWMRWIGWKILNLNFFDVVSGTRPSLFELDNNNYRQTFYLNWFWPASERSLWRGRWTGSPRPSCPGPWRSSAPCRAPSSPCRQTWHPPGQWAWPGYWPPELTCQNPLQWSWAENYVMGINL